MITRPLDLASKLRPPPRSYDWVFFVNITLIVLFFLFFGSRFVLFPALVVNGGSLRPPVVATSQVAYVPGAAVVSVKSNGQIFIDTGLVSQSQLSVWLVEKIKHVPDPSLLIRADANVPLDEITQITEAATQAGFTLISLAVEPGEEGLGIAPARNSAGEGRGQEGPSR